MKLFSKRTKIWKEYLNSDNQQLLQGQSEQLSH